MKNFIKGRWFPFLLLLVGLVVVLLGGFLLGFRITYAPALENSWEAISGVAAWVSILASIGGSFAAVWYAVRVADKQNKISMFEKRYKIYETFNRFKDFSRGLKNRKSDKDILQIYLKSFHDVLDENKGKDDAFFMEHCISMCNKLRYDYLLFQNVETSIYTHKLVCGLLDVIGEVVAQRDMNDGQKDPSAINKAIDAFYELINSEDYNKTLREMEKELMLK